MPRQKFQKGTVYWNAYTPPEGGIPKGWGWVCVKRHPEKGYPEGWQLKEVGVKNNEPPGIDGLPPAGLEGVSLSKEPPRTMGGVTAEQLERSARLGYPVTHVDMSAKALESKER